MRPSRLAVACALALLAVGAAPVTAAPATRVLTIRGAKNAYVDVTFATRFRLHTDDHRHKDAPRITTTGTYGGFYVVPLGKGPEAVGAGTIQLQGLPVFANMAMGIGTFEWLPAGRYRVHLLADAETTVRVHGEGLRRDLSLRPAKPSATAATFVHRTTGGADVPVDRTVIPVSIRPNTVTLLAGQQDSNGVVMDQYQCLHPPARPEGCATGDGIGGNFLVTGTPAGRSAGSGMIVYPGEHPPGEAEADFIDVTAGVPRGMYAFALTIS